MKKLQTMWQSATIATKERTIIFFITWIFSVYALANNLIHNGLDADTVQSLAATIVTGGASVMNWWKNNSFSAEAIAADEYKEILKLSVYDEIDEDNEITEDENASPEEEEVEE